MGKFKVGDRVRCIDDSYTSVVKRGEEYDVVGVNDPYIDVLEDGEPRGMYAHRFELVAPAITITPGKFYRTRDGRKVGNIHKDFGFWFGRVVGESGSRAFEPDGKHGNKHIQNNPDLDLIAEWHDTPSAPIAAQVDAIAEEYGPPPAEPDATLNIKFTSDFSELDAAILVRKKKLKKLIKLARKAGIELREAA